MKTIEMTLLEKIKDDYAKELYCEDWYALLMEIPIKKEELDVHDEVAKRYAKAVLERAAENAKVQRCNNDKGCGMPYCEIPCWEVDKQSILNTDLE